MTRVLWESATSEPDLDGGAQAVSALFPHRIPKEAGGGVVWTSPLSGAASTCRGCQLWGWWELFPCSDHVRYQRTAEYST